MNEDMIKEVAEATETVVDTEKVVQIGQWMAAAIVGGIASLSFGLGVLTEKAIAKRKAVPTEEKKGLFGFLKKKAEATDNEVGSDVASGEVTEG